MKTWLVYPFSRVAGLQALLGGVLVLLATAIVGAQWGVYTDGVIDLHVGPSAPLTTFLMLSLVVWLLPVAGLLLVGHLLTTTEYRFVDLLGTQALARWPMLPAAAIIGAPPYRAMLEDSTAAIMADPAGAGIDVVIALVLAIPSLLGVVWMVWLMYHSYALVFNLKGARAVWSFVLVLIGAELASKIVIAALL